jgi:hypothetical protein
MKSHQIRFQGDPQQCPCEHVLGRGSSGFGKRIRDVKSFLEATFSGEKTVAGTQSSLAHRVCRYRHPGTGAQKQGLQNPAGV